MLPWRVQFQRMLEGLRDDAGFRNRLLGFLLVLALLIGAFATGLEVSIKIGGTSSDGQVATGLATGTDDSFIDGSEGSADGLSPAAASGEGSAATRRASGAASGSRRATAAATGGTTTRQTTQTASAPGPGGPSYEELLREQLQAFTQIRDCSGVRTAATDQGITDKELKVGWLIPNLNELQAAGFKVGLTGDWDRIIAAWVNEVNRLKLACRKVVAVKEVFDVLSVDDMIAKCKAMTEDHKVFAVFTPGGYDSVAQLCIARDHKTPFINPEPEPAGWYREAAPYLWNMLMSKDRMHRNHVRWLAESGTLKASHTVGVVYHDIPNVGPPVRDAMLPELAANGIRPKRTVALSSDSEQAVSQINQVVVEFQQEGIDFVFMPMNLIFKSQFMQQAEKQEYYPTYTDSDHYFGCFDFVTAAYPARSWQGTKCVSAVDVAGWRTEDARKYAEEHAFARYADQAYLRSFPDGYDRDGRDNQERADVQRALFIGTGEQVLLFKQAADRAGIDLTRPKWGAAMGQTGRYCTVIRLNCVSFGPQKWDAPDYINVVQWFAEATDGYEERRYHQILAPFPAYY